MNPVRQFDPVERYHPMLANSGIVLVHLLGIFLKLSGHISSTWAELGGNYIVSIILMTGVSYWYHHRHLWPSWDDEFVHIPLTAIAIQMIQWWVTVPETAHIIVFVWVGFFPSVNGRINVQSLVTYSVFLITTYLFIFAPTWQLSSLEKAGEISFILAFIVLNIYLGIHSEMERDRDLNYIRLENALLKNQQVLSRTNDELTRLSCLDPLTNLLNRRGFEGKVSNITQNIAILAIDIDYFKFYNDNFGHPAGDQCLRQVGHILSIEAGDSAIVARYGGEEFIIALPHTTMRQANQAARHICQSLENHAIPHPTSKVANVVTVSIGIAHSTNQHIALEHLMEMADIALYEAKEAGRNQCKLFSPSFEKKTPKDITDIVKT